MRILHVTHGLPPDKLAGVELYTDALAREQAAAHGHEVAVLLPDPAGANGVGPEEWRSGDEESGYRRIHLGVRRRRLRFDDLYWKPRLDVAFARILDEVAPDLVHVQSLLSMSFGFLDVLHEARIPTVMTLHDHFAACPLGQRIRRDLDLCRSIDRERCARCLTPSVGGAWRAGGPLAAARAWGESVVKAPSAAALRRNDDRMLAALAHPRRLVAPSEFHRREMIRYGVEEERIVAVGCGLDIAAVTGEGAKDEAPPRTFSRPLRVGYLGSLMPSKGVHVLVEAFSGADSNRVRLDVHGGVAGTAEGRAYLERLDALASGEEAVRLHGRYPPGTLPGILAELDVLVVPSLWYETYGLTVREGFLAGLVVVASGHGSLAEAIEDGVTGLLFEPGDAGDLRRVLDRLVDEPDLARRIASRSKHVESMADHAKRIEPIYAEAVSGS